MKKDEQKQAVSLSIKKETETKIALRLLPRLLSSFIQPRKDTDKQVDLLDGSIVVTHDLVFAKNIADQLLEVEGN